mmetsp:Transcript_89819/g.269957  ORF Transcript_89819/g.269957 Transcript_89819/m.269957 type:complete len:274 (+) Transcript_89819:120-941(+)
MDSTWDVISGLTSLLASAISRLHSRRSLGSAHCRSLSIVCVRVGRVDRRLCRLGRSLGRLSRSLRRHSRSLGRLGGRSFGRCSFGRRIFRRRSLRRRSLGRHSLGHIFRLHSRRSLGSAHCRSLSIVCVRVGRVDRRLCRLGRSLGRLSRSLRRHSRSLGRLGGRSFGRCSFGRRIFRRRSLRRRSLGRHSLGRHSLGHIFARCSRSQWCCLRRFRCGLCGLSFLSSFRHKQTLVTVVVHEFLQPLAASCRCDVRCFAEDRRRRQQARPSAYR